MTLTEPLPVTCVWCNIDAVKCECREPLSESRPVTRKLSVIPLDYGSTVKIEFAAGVELSVYVPASKGMSYAELELRAMEILGFYLKGR